MGQKNTDGGPLTSQEPLEEPAEGAPPGQEQYHNGQESVPPLQEPAEGDPEDANAPPAADQA